MSVGEYLNVVEFARRHLRNLQDSFIALLTGGLKIYKQTVKNDAELLIRKKRKNPDDPQEPDKWVII
jgi:hypothetical protein